MPKETDAVSVISSITALEEGHLHVFDLQEKFKLRMSDLPQTGGFVGGTSSRRIPENVPASKEEEISIIDYAEPARLTSTSSATESSELCDIFRVLSNIHFEEPSLPLQGAAELGEPSTRKRKVEDLELRKTLSEGNEQLLITESKQEKKAKKSRSTETHNMSERKRRGRIKEKIKSLQQLIPNSDKRDCASILDEAIQYLKMLKDQAAQIQMMSMSMGSVYCNPYMSATGIPQMPVAQYSPYGAFRPGMRLVPLVPMLSPTLGNPSEILPLVQGPMEIPISGTTSVPNLQPSNIAMSTTSQLEDQTNETPTLKELEKDACGSQEASISGQTQIVPKPSPGSIVHATHIVPPATEEKETNL